MDQQPNNPPHDANGPYPPPNNPPFNTSGPHPTPNYMSPSGPWVTYGTGQQAYLAGAGARLGARLLDGLIMIVAAMIWFVPAWILSGVGSDAAVVVIWLGLLVGGGIAYEVGLIATKGQTLGKQAVGIKVVRVDNGQAPGSGPSLKRWGLPALFGLLGVSLLCYLSLLWGDNRQGWHDKVAGTYVIKT